MSIQLLLFEEPFEVKMENNIHKQQKTLDRMRKKLFAENGALKKEIYDMKAKLELLESNICKGNI